MWKKTGGPPVPTLAKTAAADQEDDDDDDDDAFEDADMRPDSTKMMDDITPTFSGFRDHVLALNPSLATANTYLVDRIAHQQVVRYKSLLNGKLKHLNNVAMGSCQCGSMCIDQGGVANVLDVKGGVDASRFDGSDEDAGLLEGAITQDSFPPGIPMPPTSSLPAEFECQLCFQAKRFQKPSDWTKHVHEDVQPFTCTWERCRDPKIFKRKADWVRHENEGHRHLEWWKCNVEDCRHVCYRRDNFLQHLVREHKFTEPQVKTKAAIKRAGAADPTWQKVEKCHQETNVRPQQEPCRFCGKQFPSWKKLTVHLAKHMEQISLPILGLVAKRELAADTIISPVQDPPPRSFQAFPVKRDSSASATMGVPNFNTCPSPGQPMPQQQPTTPLTHRMPNSMAYPNHQTPAYVYNPLVPPQLPTQEFGQSFYTPGQFESLGQALDTTHLNMHVNNHHASFAGGNQGYGDMPITSNGYMSGVQAPYISVSDGVEPFPTLTMSGLGLQGLQDAQARQVQYNSLMDPSSAGATDQYTSQSSSPFSHSPNQGSTNGFFGQGH
jgi:hypothetical protein